MKALCIILDPAHGADVSGKCSPDGKHKEYAWSRNRCQDLDKILSENGYEVHWTTQSINEPGLSKRKTEANQIITDKPVKLLISLHNNAAGSDGKWHNATGVEIYTSIGRTTSDIFANIMMEQFSQDFPNLKMRYGSSTEKGKEANFTVLMGNYSAMLIEWLFQDGENDIDLLLSPKVNEEFCDSVFKGIEKINDYVITHLNKK